MELDPLYIINGAILAAVLWAGKSLNKAMETIAVHEFRLNQLDGGGMSVKD